MLISTYCVNRPRSGADQARISRSKLLASAFSSTEPTQRNPVVTRKRDTGVIKVEKKRREIVPVTPYLFFDGRCEEAIDFYKKALGAEVGMMMRFNESPEKPPPGMVPPGSENKIMHACIRINGADVMASDGNAKGKPKFEGFSLTLNAKDEAAADRMFAALADGGQVQMPLGKTFFAKRFGMVADRFGVGWMIIVEP
jgi:PhnB protein